MTRRDRVFERGDLPVWSGMEDDENAFDARSGRVHKVGAVLTPHAHSICR